MTPPRSALAMPDDRHALMVRHVGTHDRHALALSQTIGREVQRLVKAVVPSAPQRSSSRKLAAAAAGIHHGRKPVA